MRLRWLAVLALPLALTACGGSVASTTVSVSCGNGTSLNGATSVDVTPAANGSAVLTYPDPANPGHTGTIGVAPGAKCTIRSTQDVVT